MFLNASKPKLLSRGLSLGMIIFSWVKGHSLGNVMPEFENAGSPLFFSCFVQIMGKAAMEMTESRTIRFYLGHVSLHLLPILCAPTIISDSVSKAFPKNKSKFTIPTQNGVMGSLCCLHPSR